jgi:hypothetical protein
VPIVFSRSGAGGPFQRRAAADSNDRIGYTAHGAVSTVRLGNGLWEHASFNSRLQPTQVGLGTTLVNSSTLRLDYTYGTSDDNGDVRTQAVTAPGAASNLLCDPLHACSQTPSFTPYYAYDGENKLTGAGGSSTYSYDGDGRNVCDSSSGSSGYCLRSAALGGAVVTELGSTGQKSQTYVYAGGTLLAAQTGGGVVWRSRHRWIWRSGTRTLRATCWRGRS